MATTYRLKVVTPDHTVYDGMVEMIVVRTTEGEIAILAKHMQIISPLVPHLMTLYVGDGKTEQLAVGGGFLEVRDQETTLLADAAETAGRVDVARAERARQRAVQRLATGTPNVDLIRAQRALARAENRLKLVGRPTDSVAATH